MTNRQENPATRRRAMSPRTWSLLPSVVLCSASMPFAAFCEPTGCSDWPGFGILLIGILDLVMTWANATWLANPLLFIAWLLIRCRKTIAALIASLLAFAVAASFLFHDIVVTNEAGIPFPITSLQIGYWLWWASTVAACVGAIALPRACQRRDHNVGSRS